MIQSMCSIKKSFRSKLVGLAWLLLAIIGFGNATSPLMGQDLSGTYKDAYGIVFTLYQNGNQVSGTYTYAPANIYQIEGTLDGLVLSGTMNQINGSEKYALQFTFASDGQTFTGGLSSWRMAMNGVRQAGVSLRLTPAYPRIQQAGDLVTYVAEVAGSPNKSVIWSTTAGSVTNGVYTIPSGYDYTTQTITASAVADSSKVASAQVTITPTGIMDVSGTYRDAYGIVFTLYQNGNQVSGTYTYASNYIYQIEGTLDGLILSGTMNQTNGPERYSLRFTFAADGQSFTGGLNSWRPAMNGVRQAGVSLRLTPATPRIQQPGDLVTYIAEVAGSPNKSVIWSTTAGSVTNGVFKVPNGYDYTTQTISASAAADTSKVASAQIGITPTGIMDVSGTYMDTYGVLFTLYQNGNQVSGTYIYSTSYIYRIEGTLNGVVLSGVMNQTNGAEKYSLQFTFAANGQSFTGGLNSWRPAMNGVRQPGVSIRLTPADPMTLRPAGSLNYLAEVAGSPNKGVSWTATAGVVSNGVFIAPVTPGVVVVTATSDAQTSVKATSTVTVAEGGNLDASGSFIASSRTMAFFQRGLMVSGDYSYSGSKFTFLGTVSGNVLTGKLTQGPTVYSFSATYAVDGKSFVGSDPWGSLTASKQTTAIARVIPSQAILKVGQTLAIDGSVGGVEDKGLTWTATGGTVDGNGFFTAPSSPGVHVVTATSNAQSAVTATTTVMLTQDGSLDASGSFTAPSRTMAFYQRGLTVTGDYFYGGSKYAFSGAVSGYSLIGLLTQGTSVFNFSATYAADGKSFVGSDPWGSLTAIKQSMAIIRLLPAQAILKVGQTLAIDGSVGGVEDKGLTWTTTGGTVDGNGVFTAPTSPGACVVRATSNAQPAVTVTMTVVVTQNGFLDASGSFTASSRTMTFFQRGLTVVGDYFYGGSKFAFSGAVSGYNLIGVLTQGTVILNFSATFAADGKSFVGSDAWGSLTAIKQNLAIVRVLPTQAILKVGQSLAIDGLVGGVDDKSLTWTVTGGVVDGNGVFTAQGSPGVYVVTAASSAQSSVRATTTVMVTEDSNLDASGSFTAPSRVMAFYQRGSTVTGDYSYGGGKFAFSGTVTGYSLIGKLTQGTTVSFFSATYAADGTGFTGTDPWGTLTATKQATAIVRVIPTQAIVQSGGTVALDGLAGGVFNNRVQWTATGGTVSSTGVYTAPYKPGIYVVTAASVVQPSVKAQTVLMVTVDGLLDASGAFSAPSRVMSFFQQAGVVTGDYSIYGTKYPFSGTVNGYSLVGTIKVGTWNYSLTATFAPDGQTFAGTDAWGSFTATRTAGAVGIQVFPRQIALRPSSSFLFGALLVGTDDLRVDWSVLEAAGGMINQDGLYQAPANVGQYTVKAVSVALPTRADTAIVQVRLPITVAPTMATIQPSATQIFVATLTGFPAGATPVWRILEAGGGTVDASGKYTAPEEAGTYTVEASASDPDGTVYRATAIITVPFTLVVTPATYIIGTAQQRLFVATLTGAVNKQVAWSVEPSSAGSITADGLYTAADTAPIPTGTLVLIRAASVARPDKTAAATLTLKQTVYVDPPAALVEPDGNKLFKATVTGLATQDVDWSTSGGTVSTTGTYFPPATAGSYVVSARSKSDGRHVGTAQISVPVRLKITPGGTIMVPLGVPVQFASIVKGASDQRVRWSLLDPSCGRISNFDDITGWQATPDPANVSSAVLNLAGDAVNANNGGIFFGLKAGTFKVHGQAMVDGTATDEVTLLIVDLIAIDPAEFTLDAGKTMEIHAWTVGYVGPNGPGVQRGSNNGGSGSPCDAAFDPTYNWMNFTTTGGSIGPVSTGVSGYAVEPGQPNLCDPSPTRKIGIRKLYQAPEEHGVYFIEVTNAIRPDSKGVAKVTVPLWVKINQPNFVWVPQGSTLKLTTTISGTSNKEVDWYVTSGLGSVDPDGTYHPPQVWPYAPGAYAGWSSTGIITVRLKEDPSKTASVWVNTGPPIWIWTDPGTVEPTSQKIMYVFVDGQQVDSRLVDWQVTGGQVVPHASQPCAYWVAPDQIGTYTVTAIRKDNPAIRTSVSYVVPFTIRIDQSSVWVRPFEQRQHTATVLGTTDKRVTWTLSNPEIGTVDANGLYSASPQGPITRSSYLTATSVADPTKSSYIFLFQEGVARYISGYTDLSPGQVGRYYFYEGNTSLLADWSVTGGAQISPEGTGASALFTAPDLEGTFTITAVAKGDPSKSATFQVRVYPTLTVTVVGDSHLYLPTSSQTQLVATVKGLADTRVTWSKNAIYPGTIDPLTGLYTPPAAPTSHGQNVYLEATSVAKPSLKSGINLFLYNAKYITLSPKTAIAAAGTKVAFATSTLTGLTPADIVWSATGGQIGQDGTYMASAESGTYTVTAAYAADPTVKDTAIVTVPLTVKVEPSPTVVFLGSKRVFTAKVSGDPTQQVVWSCKRADTDSMKPAGVVDQFGVYTPPDLAGDYLVVATSRKDATVSGAAQVLVPVDISVSPAKAILKPSNTRKFSVSNVQGATNKAVTWSVMQPDGGTIDASGLYTAPATLGSYTVIATSQADPRFFASAEVRVTESGAVEVSLTPDYVELKKNGTNAFAATVLGNDNTAVTWTCDAGTVDANGNYTAPATFGTFTVKATSVADPTVSALATIVVSPLHGDDRTYTYDENGNLLSDGTRTFEWDEENRLISVTKGTHRSEFVYDGLGRRVQVIEKELGTDPNAAPTTTSDRKFLWAGTEIAEERSGDDGGTVQKRFFAQGFVDSDGTILLYTRDHLGSIRELVDMNQVVRARYDYDPYGNVTKVSGDRDSDFLYTGHYWHPQSGLFLTLYRAYDPELGRWISRDPIEESGGINMYAYVDNNPANYLDSLGLYPGQMPPAPPGYDPGKWGQRFDPRNGKPILTDPEGGTWVPHPEDADHWRHWDYSKNGKRFRQRPEKSMKPDKGHDPDDVSESDPNCDAPEWTPAPEDKPLKRLWDNLNKWAEEDMKRIQKENSKYPWWVPRIPLIPGYAPIPGLVPI